MASLISPLPPLHPLSSTPRDSPLCATRPLRLQFARCRQSQRVVRSSHGERPAEASGRQGESQQRAFAAAGTAALIGGDPQAAADAAAAAARAGDSALSGLDSADPAADSARLPAGVSADLSAILSSQRRWTWRGASINYCDLPPRAGGGAGERGEGAWWGREDAPAVVLVHGFGASIGHWRRTAPAVAAAGQRVFAVDLLGLGASEKPSNIEYTIDTWAEMLQAFVSEVVRCRVVLVGNSIGSLVALAAAAALPEEVVAGVVLVNCAGGLNNKAIQDDWRIRLALPVFLLIDCLLSFPPLATAIFNRVKTRDNVASVLRAVYCNHEAVDDELVQLICAPADDPGALQVFIAVLTGPPGPRPEQLMPRIAAPLLLLWGEQDPFTPLDGPVGRFFSLLPQQRPRTTLVTLPHCGHCPHDDQPLAVHQALLPWLAQLGGEE
ncbi:hypothetical protein CLOM_g16057 [Closterium sp. NIES-68]|nr:hypothetical protein CLOM_g16057 [Closterium sp. NIES-68]GJP59234.1 hypothetical protein CLOP_g9960 [Closterium sp. NIES-67]